MKQGIYIQLIVMSTIDIVSAAHIKLAKYLKNKNHVE